jgi:aspartyl-tRNA synthetase
VFENVEGNAAANALFKAAEGLGREFCVRVVGTCRERTAKNPRIPTG